MPLTTSDIQPPANNALQTTITATEHFSFVEALGFIENSGATSIADHINEEQTTLKRLLRLDDGLVFITMQAVDDNPRQIDLTVRTIAEDGKVTETQVKQVIAWADRRFWLSVEMDAVKKAMSVDDYGKNLIERFYPTRPANYPSAWEALLKSVVHSQIYASFAKNLDAYLCVTYGETREIDGETYHLYPEPPQMMAMSEDDLRAAKFSRQKASYLMTIPQQMLDNPDTYDFAAMRDQAPDDIVATLKELHGVGDWTAQNVAMRGLPHTDVFIDEKATRSTLTPVYGKKDKLGKRDMKAAVEKFAPYRSFACYYTYMYHFNMS